MTAWMTKGMICFNLMLLFVMWVTPAHLVQTTLVQTTADITAYTATVAQDTTEMVLRRPPAEVMEAFLNSPDYQYNRGQPGALSWWQELKQWFFNWLSELFEENEQDTFWSYLLYGVALLVVVYGILKLLKMDARGLFSAQKKRPQGVFLSSIENIQVQDFLLLADQAFQAGNLRVAARMYYMHVLKILDEQEVIVWTPRKTNQDYLSECRLPEIRSQFARLTYLFDYSWYGDFPVDKSLIEEIRSLALSVGAKNGGGT